VFPFSRLTNFDAGAATFVYDGDGNRVAKTSGGVTTQYLVDDANPTGLAQVAEEVVNGAVTRRYVYGLGRISQTQASGTSYYGYDAHGDVRTLMNASGTVTDTYDYDAFGNLIASTGTTANVYRYQGEALDTETGLYYLRARHYDPTAGRFLSVDPLASEGNHPYTYASADPVNGHDPAGQQDVFEYKPLLVGPLTWPHFSLAMVTGGGGHGGGSPPGCLGGGGGGTTSFLEWIGVCQIPSPPMPKPPSPPALPAPPEPCGGQARIDVQGRIAQAKNLLCPRCKSKFAAAIPGYTTSGFFDTLSHAMVNQYPIATPPQDWASYGADAITHPPTGPIDLLPNFYGLCPKTQAFVLIHEGIHLFGRGTLPDVVVQDLFHIPRSSDTNNITQYIEGGCQG
jgi:RHS repeat-associated protein